MGNGGSGSPSQEETTVPQYLLSMHSAESDAREAVTDEQMQRFMDRVHTLEEEMRASATYVFGGALHGPDTATVVRVSGDDVLTTDGPFAESKEHLGGFYIIEAPDLDAALEWARKTSDAVSHAIEVRPFRHASLA
jgi:hypothetical protein